jgi:Domain of unknown function (DUF4252)
MRKFILMLTLTLLVAVPASAQRLNLDFLADLEDRADEVVDVTLDASMLRLAAKFLNGRDADERAIADMINRLEGIYVRSFEFDREGEYDRNLINRIKSQLGSNWKPLVTVRSKTKENVNIYADMRGENIHGLVVIAAEPRELTVVNIVGPIDIEKLSSLQGQFGIPHYEKEKNRD